MCCPNVMSSVQYALRRRDLLTGTIASAVAAVTSARAAAEPKDDLLNNFPGFAGRFEQVIDCSQVLEPGIPSYFGLQMTIRNVSTVEANGVYINELTLPEHLSTHFDTPSHFIAGGITGESIRPEQLFGPLVIIDIAERAARDVNTEVTVDDLLRWERRNGRIPRGAFVAMFSNWAARWPTDAYLNTDASGTYNFPGFGGEAGRFLVTERNIIGIGCDSHSLDVGPSKTYPAHLAVLGAGKIGVEVLAGLDRVLQQTRRRDREWRLPYIFIGAMKTLHGSGSPVRALALV